MATWKLPFERAVQICAVGPLGQEEQYQQSYEYLQNFWNCEVNDIELIQYMTEIPSLHTVAQLNDVLMRRHMEHSHKYQVDSLKRIYTSLFHEIFDIENSYNFSMRALMIRTVMRIIHCHAFELLFLFEELGMAYHTLIKYSHMHNLHPIFFKCVEELFVEFTTAVPRYGKFTVGYRDRCDADFKRLLIPNLMVHVLDTLDHVSFDVFPFDLEVESSLSSFLTATKLAMFWNENDDAPILLCPFTISPEFISFIERLRDKMFYLFERCLQKADTTIEILTIISRIVNAMGSLVEDTNGLYYLELQNYIHLLTYPDTFNLYREGVLSILMVIGTRAALASRNFPIVTPIIVSVASVLEGDVYNLLPLVMDDVASPLDFLRNYERTMSVLMFDCEVPAAANCCYHIARTIVQQLTVCNIEDAQLFGAVVQVATIGGSKMLPDFADNVSNLFNRTLLDQNDITDLEYFRRMRTVLAVISNVGSRIIEKLPSSENIVADYFQKYPDRFSRENLAYLLSYDAAIKQHLLPNTDELDPVGRFTTYSIYLFEKVFAVISNDAHYPPLIQSIIYYVTDALSKYLTIVRYDVHSYQSGADDKPIMPFLILDIGDFAFFAKSVFKGLLKVLVSQMNNKDVHPVAIKCMRTMAENGYYSGIISDVKDAIIELPRVSMPSSFFSAISYIYFDAAERRGPELYLELFWLAQHVGSNRIQRTLAELNLYELGTMVEFYTGIADTYRLFTPSGLTVPLMEFHDAVIRFLPQQIMNPDFADKVIKMIEQFSRIWHYLEETYFTSYLRLFFESLRLVMTAYEPFWAERDASASDVGSYAILERLLDCLKNVLLRATENEIRIIGEMGVYVALHHLNATRIAVIELQTPFMEYLECIVVISCGIEILSRVTLNTDWFRRFIYDCITSRYGVDKTESGLNVFFKIKVDFDTEAENPEWVAYLRRLLPLFVYTAFTNASDEDIFVGACAVMYRYYVHNIKYFAEFFYEFINTQPTDKYKEDILEAFNRICDIGTLDDFRHKFFIFYKNVSRKVVLPPGMSEFVG